MEFDNQMIVSTIAADGTVTVTINDVILPAPAADEIVIQVEACAINPSDMSMMLGPADPASLRVEMEDGRRVLYGRIAPERLAPLAGRFGKPVPVGNEGAGTIVAAGADMAHLVGRKCCALLPGMYQTFKLAKGAAVVILPENVEPPEAAGMFVNPLTVVAMVDTMRSEGHRAIVHTAAASNLGQMLARYCREQGIPLVNVVRREEQVALLTQLGATHVCVSSAPDYEQQLTVAIAETGATIAFEAVGGGNSADQILRAMEHASLRTMTMYDRYGSAAKKQVYIYSDLEPGPTMLARDYGMAWAVGAYVLTNALAAAGEERQAAMRAEVLMKLKTVFASTFAGTIGLEALFDADLIRAIRSRRTGAKLLLDPRQ